MELQFTGKDLPLMQLPIGDYHVHPLALGMRQGERYVFGYAHPVGERWADPLPVIQVDNQLYGIEAAVLAGAAIASKREGQQ